MVVVSYDVETTTKEGKVRLRKVGRACLDFGQRVQFSVFECLVSSEQWVRLRGRLLSLFDPKTDSLRFYHLGEESDRRIEHHGAKSSEDPRRLLLV
ncbi:MAG: CRISPR-associated endonuclease Cas2 [Vicinamibacteria bacterium]